MFKPTGFVPYTSAVGRVKTHFTEKRGCYPSSNVVTPKISSSGSGTGSFVE
jgi:hypothetical protein